MRGFAEGMRGSFQSDISGYSLRTTKKGTTMAIRIVRLGTPREENEGLRIGTVRRPPRGVPKAEFATRDFYDVWYPVLSPTQELVTQALHAENDKEWRAFVKKFKTEMAEPAASKTLDLLAALSHRTNMSVGCYCEDEARCHRSVLRELLKARGADVA
jgi:uncharacterized protein YeaO (DUF488 family)